MKLFSLLATSAFASVVSSTAVLLPLYSYPTGDAWTPVYNAISSNPGVEFYVIVNPDDGPGASVFPDSNYVQGVDKLNSHNNVRVLGYVHTSYTKRPLSNVTSDIAAYSNWDSYPGKQNITVTGIFFDEVTADPTDAGYNYMQSASNAARSTIPQTAAGLTVMFNPGELEPTQYFSYADMIVEFENPYANYDATHTPASVPSQHRSQSAIIITNTPSGADVTSLVQQASAEGIAAIYLTDDCCYNSVSLVGQVAAAVAQS